MIGEENASLQQVEIAVKFNSFLREIFAGQVGERKIDPPEASLVSEVMDGKDGFERQCPFFNQRRHQRGLPVVDMNDLRGRHDAPGEFDHRLGKINKTFGVVAVVAAIGSIEA